MAVEQRLFQLVLYSVLQLAFQWSDCVLAYLVVSVLFTEGKKKATESPGAKP